MIGEKNNFPIACCCSCNATCVCVHVKMTVNTALSVSDKQRLDGSALADERKDEGKRLARSTLLLIRTSSLHGCCWRFFFFTVACIHTRRLPTTTNTDRSLCNSFSCRPAKFDASALSFVSPFKRKKKEAHRGRHRFLPSILARDSRCWTGLRFPMNLAQVIVSASFFFCFAILTGFSVAGER